MGLLSLRGSLKTVALVVASVLVVFQQHNGGVTLAQDAGGDHVVGWADEGNSNTIMCVEMFKLLFDTGGMTIQDGDIATGTLQVNPTYAHLAQAMLQNAKLTGQGVTASVNPNTRRVVLRTDGGAPQSNNGQLMDLSLALKLSIEGLAKDLPPVCKDILIKRLVLGSGNGGGSGDPHLRTLDRVAYDFQVPGVFRLFESGNLQVQVFQHKCTPTRLNRFSPSCYQGVAVAFAGSVVRIFIEDSKIVLSKGSSDLEWLSVHKLKGGAEGYRVFTKADEATYVDVMLSTWIDNYRLFNVALRVSPYFKGPGVHGLLGNWNGVKTDDLTNNAALAQLHGFALADNLFTCAGNACGKFVLPATEKDRNATMVQCDMGLLREGFVALRASDIAERAFAPSVDEPAMALRLRRRVQTDDDPEFTDEVVKRAGNLCVQVFKQMALCYKYVANTANYVQAVCFGDAVLVGDLSIVDATKLTYLRECRREIDARIEANVSTPLELEQLLAERKVLTFGDAGSCPNGCSGRGSCLPVGCACNHGFTGLVCDIATT
ncbi:hypothetical protein PybrP1_013200 [[Pythium] brassicae (nom. inval.)]|nr:hypothetical protein PybrP1_013200 [[Pythium] brassicae (nom. inval.)]